MSILTMLGMAKGAGEALATPVEAVGKALDKLFTSDEERAKGEFVLAQLRQQPHLLQAEWGKLEAQHRSVFVAGWRPFIGWVAGLSLAAYYIPKFLVATAVWGWWCWQAISAGGVELPSYPIEDEENLIELVMALLGLGALRTWEKTVGKAR
uniref:Holin of 3TMs, for gene-transfer release n=1 Tax=Magnetococcus massalia (strain MO-1) TaxID=451514 RepID=A0A1S7LH61_MAGMO|nr:conserved protein of unknown function [Candidatus Magnetococcus massalia]